MKKLVGFEDDLVPTQVAQWVVRRNVGLTAGETDEFFEFMAAHPESLGYYRKYQRLWDELDDLAEYQKRVEGDITQPSRKGWLGRFYWGVPAIAASMVVALGVALYQEWGPENGESEIRQEFAASDYVRHVLPDGSIVELNEGASVQVRFGERARMIELLAKEAHFSVAKDSTRPFVVMAGGVEVLATGTAFNVKLNEDSVEVLVTEGEVRLLRRNLDSEGSLPQPHDDFGEHRTDSIATSYDSLDPARASINIALSASQFAEVQLRKEDPKVDVVDETVRGLNKKLAWKPMLLTFDSQKLSEVVDVFNKVNKRRVVFGDEEIKSIPVVASFRSANLDHFIELVQLSFDVEAEFVGKDLVVLRKPKEKIHP